MSYFTQLLILRTQAIQLFFWTKIPAINWSKLYVAVYSITLKPTLAPNLEMWKECGLIGLQLKSVTYIYRMTSIMTSSFIKKWMMNDEWSRKRMDWRVVASYAWWLCYIYYPTFIRILIFNIFVTYIWDYGDPNK